MNLGVRNSPTFDRDDGCNHHRGGWTFLFINAWMFVHLCFCFVKLVMVELLQSSKQSCEEKMSQQAK